MHGTQLTGRMQWLEGLEETTPQLLLYLVGDVAVIDVLTERQVEGFLDVLGEYTRLSLVPGEQPESLDVEDEVVRGTFGPLLRRDRKRYRVVARVDLHHRELRG